MKVEGGTHRLEVRKADLSGSIFDDVNLSGGDYHNVNLSGCSIDNANMSGWRVHNANLSGLKIDKANLAGASIVDGRLEGMTIEGISVTELLAFWREGHRAVDAMTGEGFSNVSGGSAGEALSHDA
jgi:uncharacterized protein YjbI with pentapeptide repeats